MNDRTEPFLVSRPGAAPLGAQGVLQRYASLDVARGIIMIIMALDHASVGWNEGRVRFGLEGLVVGGTPSIDYGPWTQQITREITHICAPGFQLLAGMGLAISVFRRRQRGLSEWAISGDMVLRGFVLCFCDFVLMYFAYGGHPFWFMVLACIGCCTIIFSLARKLPLALIALLSLAVLFAQPLYLQTAPGVPSVGNYPINILFNAAVSFDDSPWWWVLYPVFPWIACFGIGWCLGTLYERKAELRFERLALIGAAMVVAAFLLRWFGGTYADRLPLGEGPGSAAFWALSKYPPSVTFQLATVGLMMLMLGLLRPLDSRDRLGGAWWIALVYGRVSLFFFIVHMYLYETYPFTSGTNNTYSLTFTYGVWLTGLIVMFPLCLLYHRARVRWPRVLRYF